MRLSLGVEVVQLQGEPIKEALYWPVYIAVDDSALRFLAGDVSSSDWIDAPGPQGEAPSFRRDVASRGVAGAGYLGFGLLYSDGGADDEATQASYEELVSTLHTLVLEHVARVTGLGVMLGAFGSSAFDESGREGEPVLDRLRDGLDPAELAKDLDPGVMSGIGAFRAVRDILLPFTPGISAASLSTAGKLTAGAAIGAKNGTMASARSTTAAGATAAAAATATAATTARRPVKRRATGLAAEAGRVLALTVQAWRVEEIAEKGELEIRRELPTRDEKTKLTLEGRVGRDDQR